MGEEELSLAALAVLDDPTREFITSDYVRLETLPKPRFLGRSEQVQFMEEFFRAAMEDVISSATVTGRAIQFASTYDLSSMDALHVSSAVEVNADELITLEKPEKPMGRVTEIPIKSLQTPSHDRTS